MTFFDLLWLFLILSSLTPMLRQRYLEEARLRMLRRLEKRRGSRVITLIHRQESLSFLGLPLSRFINIEDSEAVLRAIRLTPDETPIDLILHTPGGLVLAAEQIARALAQHPARVTVMVPHYAMSGGTLIAMAADQILMDPHAVLGPVDPQLGQYPAASVLAVLEQKPIDQIEDQTLILADVARKAIGQVHRTVRELLTTKGMPEEQAEEIARILSHGRWTHDYPITVEEARELGLPVEVGLPEEVYALMALYPQPAQHRPSVQYVPAPAPTPRQPAGREGGRR